ncbi:MAG: hypothetical protein ABJN14_03100 [Paracoccaceae bacterium]
MKASTIMVKIRLSREKYTRLLDIVATKQELADKPARILPLIERFHTISSHHPSNVFADFSENEADEIGDFLHDLLVQIGFDDDYDLNPIGLELEGYIDTFSRI